MPAVVAPRITNVELRAGLNTVSPQVETSFVNTRTSINYVNTRTSINYELLNAGVTYEQLFAETNWVNAQAETALSVSGLIKFVYDTVSLTDALQRDISPPVGDDTTNISDQISSISTNKGLTDDNFAFLENVSLLITFQRTFLDTAFLNESPSLDINKGLSDALSLADAIDSDVISGQFPVDNQPILDDTAFSIEKGLSDSLFMNDLIDSDDIESQLATTDMPFVNDSLAIEYSLADSDSVTIGDSVQIVTFTLSNSTVNASAVNAFAING